MAPDWGPNINSGALPHYVHSHHAGFNKYNQYFYIRVGLIVDVDYDKYQMTVQWASETGQPTKIPISLPYSGPASCIGGLPEWGAIGIFGFMNEGDGHGKPLLLNYLPAGLDAGLNFNVVKVLPDAIATSDVNEILFKFRKLTDGDLIFASADGGALFVNNNVELYDNAQDSIKFSEDEQSIITTSLQNLVFANGVSVCMGPALRPGMRLYDNNGRRILNNGATLPTENRDDLICIVPFGKEVDADTEFYSEYRIEVDEKGDGKLPQNEINSSFPSSNKDPVIVMALGNYIGSNRDDPQKYGYIQKVKLFESVDDQKGLFSLENCVQNNVLDEPSILGLAYALDMKKSKLYGGGNNSFIGIDKEGHYSMYLQASSKNPLGAGRSMSILAKGNLKEIWGASAKKLNSWDLTTKGGILWNVGNHSSDLQSRSIHIKTSKGVRLDVNAADDEGYAKREFLQGNVDENVSGDKKLSCSNLTMKINGLKTENVLGSTTEAVQSDKTVNVLGVSTENVTKEKQCKFGKRKTTITTGNDELEVIRGNIDESITTFGKRKTSILSGGIEESIGTGSYETSIKLGSYKLNVTTGGIELKTNLGTVTVSGTTVAIKGTALVNIEAPLVKVGKGALVGGIVSGLPGKPNHFDYMSGAPLKGSMKVSVG